MPYKLREDAYANTRMKYRVKVLESYKRDHVEALDPSASRSDIYCPDCHKISKYSTPTQFRHFSDCEHYTGDL